MAKQDSLVTFRTEGEIKAFMRGEDCRRYVMTVENHIIDPDDFDIFKGFLGDETSPADLQPMISELWTWAERHREEVGEFNENKLLEVRKELEESDLVFVERIKIEYDQVPVHPQMVNEDGAVIVSPSWFILKPDFCKRLKRANSYGWFEKLFGVVWVGLPPFRVFHYRFRWIKYAQKETSSDGKPSSEVIMTPREEEVSSLYFSYPLYGLVVENVETGKGTLKIGEGTDQEELQEKIQLKLEFVMETRTRNPQKTLFRTAGLSSAGEWLGAIMKELRDEIRPWIGGLDYDKILGNKEAVAGKLAEIIKGVNGRVAIPTYGQEIVWLALVSVSLQNPGLQASIDSIFTANQQRRQAEIDARRDIAKAIGRKALTASTYLGKAQGMREIAAIPDGAGTRMRIAESIGEGGIRVLNAGGGGQATLVNLPDVLLGENPAPSAEEEEGG